MKAGRHATRRSALAGGLASLAMLGIYFGVLAAVSGRQQLASEFGRNWHYVLLLALAFGVQVGLFMRLREVVGATHRAGATVAASGTTSTAAMVSCCAHYLANIAPLIGATGLVAFAAQFQVQLFWAGLLFSSAGIAYIATQLRRALREHAPCPA